MIKMGELFPRTNVGGISLSRMIIGTNWLLGFSHKSSILDNMIKNHHNSKDTMVPMLEAFVNNGIDTIMAPFDGKPVLLDAIKQTEDNTGKKMILVDTPVINIEDSAQGRKEAREKIKQSRENGASVCLIHHASAEQLVNKEKHEIRRIDDYTKMIRDEGMIPGLSAHMPELITFSDEQGYDVETYIQIYNCMGFLMQVEVEYINKVIRTAKKPVMTIKSMAAGRTTPFIGLTFSWATLRDCDMVTVGCYSAEEALYDIEISRAAFEKRLPDFGARSSPAPTQAAFKND